MNRNRSAEYPELKDSQFTRVINRKRIQIRRSSAKESKCPKKVHKKSHQRTPMKSPKKDCESSYEESVDIS